MEDIKEVTRQRDLLMAAILRIRDGGLNAAQMNNAAHDVIVEIVMPEDFRCETE